MIAICENPGCSLCGRETEIKWDGLQTLALMNLRRCPECGKLRNLAEPPKNEGNKLESIGTTLIDSMTPMERKKLLKERSNRDFKKNIEAQKREMDKNVIPR